MTARQSIVHRLARVARRLAGTRATAPAPVVAEGHAVRAAVLDQYVTVPPSARTAIDIFHGEWSSILPEPLADVPAGTVDLFSDPRVRWFIEVMGGVSGNRVLELGPLEGGHSYMLAQAGAEVVAIEANVRAFLKCLIVKELLGLPRVRFQCGDFLPYLRATSDVFEICIASGVLYHMQNPAELVALLARHCNRFVCLWTHYYDGAIVASTPRFAEKFVAAEPCEFEGFRHTLHRQEYQAALQWAGFCGAGSPTSHWMTRDDLFRCLDHFGWDVVDVGFDQPDHQNGPALALVARRRAS
jgi:2-polyprenyl-3-methyl-5-hydroxy-6-metoxy-1,4-benzoquinol methylase